MVLEKFAEFDGRGSFVGNGDLVWILLCRRAGVDSVVEGQEQDGNVAGFWGHLQGGCIRLPESSDGPIGNWTHLKKGLGPLNQFRCEAEAALDGLKSHRHLGEILRRGGKSAGRA